MSPPQLPVYGGCLCGAVRYACREAPIVTRICWCRVCQYFGSGHGTVNTWFRTESMTVSGELHDYATIADSGRHMHRRFCPRCGTHVFTHAEERAERIGVRSGTLDEAAWVRPSVIVWVSRAPHWAVLDPALPHVSEQPGAIA